MKSTHFNKDGSLDMRFRHNKTAETKELIFWKKYGVLVVVGILGFLFGIVVNKTAYDLFYKKPEAKQTPTASIAKPVEANETPYCYDPIACIRDVGEELGRDNKTIMTMIRIAQKESGMNPRAKNPKSSASGLFQIIAGTWYSNDCVGDKWNFEDNIRCAYKIQECRGFQPWEVCHTGVANCY